jgi:transposase
VPLSLPLDSLQPALPQAWLPDETLFSFCSRYHAASGNRLSSTTCRQLYGHPTQGCAHDFPARLDYLRSIAGDGLGTVEAIVEQRSVLPLYLRFASDSLIKTTLSAAALSSSGHLKFQLGLLTSSFRANHPLKACRLCMIEDAERHITPYWHREHQLPGVCVCSRHGCWLQSSDLKATGVHRFHWLLPFASQFAPAVLTPPPASAVRLTQMVAGLVNMPGLRICPQRMNQAIRAELDKRGLLSGETRRLRHLASGDAYIEFLSPLLTVEQLDQLPATKNAACAAIARQLAPARSGVHPLHRLAIAAWLFHSPEELLARMEQQGPREATIPSQKSSNTVRSDSRRDRFLELVTAGSSTSAAARELGIDTTTGMAWAARAGVPTSRRPKLLKGELRGQLIAMLRSGVGKSEVAELGGVSVQTVTTLLRTEVGLHEAWRLAGFSIAQQHNRSIWQLITTANPISGVKAARLAEPAVYAWLYRNDHDWLTERTAELAKAARAPCSRVDWDARDQQLADQVRWVALQMSETQAVRRIRLCDLCQRIPDLKAKLLKLDRLPLTRAAIFLAVRRERPA